MTEIIACYPLRLRYTKGRGRTAKNRGSYITKCIRNQEKKQKQQRLNKMDDKIREIIREFKDGNNEPLDGDAVDRVVDLIRDRINEIEGNA